MEEGVFRLPDVLRTLKQNFVEARLHADGQQHIERIREVQAELTGSIATPIYVVQDPVTGEVHGKLEGARFGEGVFEGFLLETLERGPW